MTKNPLLKRGPKNSGMERPPPPPHHSGNARKKTFFFHWRLPLLSGPRGLTPSPPIPFRSAVSMFLTTRLKSEWKNAGYLWWSFGWWWRWKKRSFYRSSWCGGDCEPVKVGVVEWKCARKGGKKGSCGLTERYKEYEKRTGAKENCTVKGGPSHQCMTYGYRFSFPYLSLISFPIQGKSVSCGGGRRALDCSTCVFPVGCQRSFPLWFPKCFLCNKCWRKKRI